MHALLAALRCVCVCVCVQHALTPLHQATLGKSRAVCELLLTHGADLYATDAVRVPPLVCVYVCVCACLVCVTACIVLDCVCLSRSLPPQNGHSAVDLATRFEGEADGPMLETMEFLRQWAADHPAPA